MRRREFLTTLAGVLAAKPVGSLAQQSERVARIGVLMHSSADEREPQARLTAFVQGLEEAGWSVGRNVRVEACWSTGDQARLYKDAVEVMALHPDAVLAGVGATTPALQQAGCLGAPKPVQGGRSGPFPLRTHTARFRCRPRRVAPDSSRNEHILEGIRKVQQQSRL
jgi:hypothetical protein